MRARLFMVAVLASMLPAPAAHAAPDADTAKLLQSTADQSKFKALQQEFNSEPEITKACLSSHTEAAKQDLNASNRRNQHERPPEQ